MQLGSRIRRKQDDSLRLAEVTMNQACGPLCIVLLCALMPLASGTVSISNDYYTDGLDVKDEVYLENIGYDNSIDIYPDSITGGGSAHSSEETAGKYEEKVTFPGNGIGASLSIESSKMSSTKSIAASRTDLAATFSYNMKGGESKAALYNVHTAASHNLYIDGCEYSGSFYAKPSGLSLTGDGLRLSDDYTRAVVLQDFNLEHAGKSANIYLSVMELTGIKAPLTFNWRNSLDSSNQQTASSSVDFFVTHGERVADFTMEGTGVLPEYMSDYIEPVQGGVYTDEHWWMLYNING
jgi:hypothetical protein